MTASEDHFFAEMKTKSPPERVRSAAGSVPGPSEKAARGVCPGCTRPTERSHARLDLGHHRRRLCNCAARFGGSALPGRVFGDHGQRNLLCQDRDRGNRLHAAFWHFCLACSLRARSRSRRRRRVSVGSAPIAEPSGSCNATRDIRRHRGRRRPRRLRGRGGGGPHGRAHGADHASLRHHRRDVLQSGHRRARARAIWCARSMRWTA